MSAIIEVYVTNLNRYISVEGGSTLSEVIAQLPQPLGFDAICARVNNRNEALNFTLYSPATVEYLGVGTPSGYRTYIRSLCMMLYHVVVSEVPGAPRLVIEHSVSRGYYCRVTGGEGFSPDAMWATRLSYAMRRLVDADIPFLKFQRRTDHVIEMFRAQGLDDKVRLLSTLHEPYTAYYQLGDICDSY